MTVLSVRHQTRYDYRTPVRFGEHRLMFRPRDSYDQRLISSDVRISPEPKRVRWFHDVFGNCVAVAAFAGEATSLTFDTSIVLDHTPSNAPDFEIEDHARTYPFTYGAEERPDISRLIECHYLDPDHQLDKWVRRFTRYGQQTNTGELLMTLTYAIKESFTYMHRNERGTQDPLHTLSTGKGSCRDFAVLMMEAVRTLGFAARFVSGYLHVPPAEGETHSGGGNTHAWCQVYLPGAGWVEFDPTNGIVGNRDLIRVAVARDPRQAIPLQGTFFGAAADYVGMSVQVDVEERREGAPVRTQAPPPAEAPTSAAA
ncbi:MAG TPA: transglutaminase family protein [Lichenihabitans sp.]|jgi:transglutaminase-like putative cysteine protease|nr:transglutaminase family protein [Lichenihabitans sp.]